MRRSNTAKKAEPTKFPELNVGSPSSASPFGSPTSPTSVAASHARTTTVLPHSPSSLVDRREVYLAPDLPKGGSQARVKPPLSQDLCAAYSVRNRLFACSQQKQILDEMLGSVSFQLNFSSRDHALFPISGASHQSAGSAGGGFDKVNQDRGGVGHFHLCMHFKREREKHAHTHTCVRKVCRP